MALARIAYLFCALHLVAMMILRLRSVLEPKKLCGGLENMDAIAVRSDIAEAAEEIELAHHLAKRAFGKGKNIAKKMKYEFLLWLAGKTDIRSAMEATAPREGEDFLLVVFSDSKTDAVCRILAAEKMPLGLKKEADPLRLERISLSRIRG
jgi:tRNA threonylcarbamoyladenosine modification (KEOPS) complex Cgi121 subunit